MGRRTRTQQRRPVEAVAEPPQTGSLALVQRSAHAVSAALHAPDAEKLAVARFLNIEADDPALLAVIALGKAYGLSPFLGELFVIDQKAKSRDAEGKKVERWIKKPGAGRDGFLSVAQKSGVFRGLQADVVCANDTYDVDWSAVDRHGNAVDPMDRPRVTHRHAPMKPGASPGEARKYRGPIIGAWAIARRSDQVPFFYFAPLTEHGRTWEANDGRKGWAGAWEYTSAMSVKAAASYVLRMQFSITGIVPLDELKYDPSMVEDSTAVDITQVLDVDDTIPAGTDPEVGERLLAAVHDANELDPTLWPAAKCELVFAGRTSDELHRLAEDIERTTAGMIERMAAAAAKAKGKSPEGGEEVVDAEVVGQTETAPDQVTADQMRAGLADLEARASAAQTETEREELERRIERVREDLAQLGEHDGAHGAMEA